MDKVAVALVSLVDQRVMTVQDFHSGSVFFERTEIIARSVIDMWLELFILSVIIAVFEFLLFWRVSR